MVGLADGAGISNPPAFNAYYLKLFCGPRLGGVHDFLEELKKAPDSRKSRKRADRVSGGDTRVAYFV